MTKYDWYVILQKLGFNEIPVGMRGSQFIMEKDGFEVEYSTNGLWENENKRQYSITDFKDLNLRYCAKVGKMLET